MGTGDGRNSLLSRIRVKVENSTGIINWTTMNGNKYTLKFILDYNEQVFGVTVFVNLDQ